MPVVTEEERVRAALCRLELMRVREELIERILGND